MNESKNLLLRSLQELFFSEGKRQGKSAAQKLVVKRI